jgi:D-beta-D-heptose 7-phosphate kinase/D-beta-D-heptose 1-phosphate adenosyltransferase
MSGSLLDHVDAFAGLDVVVVGEAMLDSYLEGTSGRLCQEAPVPIVNLARRRDAPGGAANTAANLRALGARVQLVSAIGDDNEGSLLRRALLARDVPTDNLQIVRGRRTLTKHRLTAASQLLVRFDQGSTEPLDQVDERALADRLAASWEQADAVIVSDYGYGILTPAIIAVLAALQARAPRVVVADSKNLAVYRQVGLTAIKPNYDQAVDLLGLPKVAGSAPRLEQIAARGERLLDRAGAQLAAVTLDADGALIFERGGPPYRTYARAQHNTLAAGAGDTFISALALALATGAATPAAAELASAAASVVVSKNGTASCSAIELREAVSGEDRQPIELRRLVAKVDAYRQQGRRIVFTNGCFDILHRGHITYLNRARAIGDLLVVGLNSDASVRRLKGTTRPINTLEDRAQVLAALSCVDHVVAFEEDTPVELIRALRPEIFVKGGDYSRETLPEASVVEALGGVVRILPYIEDHSTSSIIERIRLAELAARQPAADEPDCEAAWTEQAVGAGSSTCSVSG